MVSLAANFKVDANKKHDAMEVTFQVLDSLRELLMRPNTQENPDTTRYLRRVVYEQPDLTNPLRKVYKHLLDLLYKVYYESTTRNLHLESACITLIRLCVQEGWCARDICIGLRSKEFSATLDESVENLHYGLSHYRFPCPGIKAIEKSGEIEVIANSILEPYFKILQNTGVHQEIIDEMREFAREKCLLA